MCVHILECNLKITDILKTLNSDLRTVILVLVELDRFHNTLNEKISQSHDSRWEKQIGKYLFNN
jgi:hypothetical protein